MKKSTFLAITLVIISLFFSGFYPAAVYAEDKMPVFMVNPESLPYGKSFNYYSTYNSYTKHYYLLRSYLEKLESTGGGTLILEKGTYVVSNTLYVPSNVTIYLKDGVKIIKGKKTGTSKFGSSLSLFQLIRPSYSKLSGIYSGYSGERNIKIIGEGNAVIDMQYLKDGIAVIAGHNSNIEIENITFKNMYSGHFIEIDATENAVIKNNKFFNSKPSPKKNKEAINIDTPDKATGGWSSKWSSFDKTPNKNITIEGNVFYNLDRAVGTHKYSEGKYHDGIVIKNNYIEKTRNDAIRVLNWSNAVITGNTIKNVASKKGKYRGILISGAVNPTIKQNTIIHTARPMQFMPWKNSGPGSEYEVTYNELTAQNLLDLYTNYVEDVVENFIRINNVYNVFDAHTDKLYLK